MLCSFWLSTNFLFMITVAKSVIQIVDSVGVFLSALGLHNYNSLLALHLQKKYWLFFINHFHHKMPLKFNLKAPILIFWGGMPPDPHSISMLIVMLCTINLTLNFTLYKRASLIFYAPGPLISLGAPAPFLGVCDSWEHKIVASI